MLALRGLARLVEVLLMAAIALVGIGVALYCLSGLVSLGSARPDRLVHLPAIRRHVTYFLKEVTAPGGIAVLALLLGAAAIAAALLVLVGLLRSRRERLLVLDRDAEHGDLYVRPRTVSRMVRSATIQIPGITGVKRARVALRRNGQRGRVTLLASRGADVDAATIDAAVHERVDPIIEPLHLQGNIRVRLVAPRGERDGRR